MGGLEVASAANGAAKDETGNASSTSGGYSGSSYKCYLPLNCYAGHGADEIDYIHIEEGASISACAEACNEMWQCEGFVYIGEQGSCWRRRNINLLEFMTRLRQVMNVSILRRCICMVSFPSSWHLRFMFGGRSQEHRFRVQQSVLTMCRFSVP